MALMPIPSFTAEAGGGIKAEELFCAAADALDDGLRARLIVDNFALKLIFHRVACRMDIIAIGLGANQLPAKRKPNRDAIHLAFVVVIGRPRDLNIKWGIPDPHALGQFFHRPHQLCVNILTQRLRNLNIFLPNSDVHREILSPPNELYLMEQI